MATSNHTENYNLSQYAAGDPVKFLTNYNGDMAAIDAALKAIADSDAGKVPATRAVLELPLSADITLAQFIAAGLAAGTNGQANDSAMLGGVDAANFPQISSGSWTPTLYGSDTAGSPTYLATWGGYIKLNHLVIAQCTMQTTLGSTMSGMIRIGGLPFVPNHYGAGIIGYILPESSSVIKQKSINIDPIFAPNCFEIIKDLGTRLLVSDFAANANFSLFGVTAIYLTEA